LKEKLLLKENIFLPTKELSSTYKDSVCKDVPSFDCLINRKTLLRSREERWLRAGNVFFSNKTLCVNYYYI